MNRIAEGNHQGEATGLLCREGDQNQLGAIVVVQSRGVYANITLQKLTMNIFILLKPC
jgi:hypothetical protein